MSMSMSSYFMLFFDETDGDQASKMLRGRQRVADVFALFWLSGTLLVRDIAFPGTSKSLSFQIAYITLYHIRIMLPGYLIWISGREHP